MADSVHTDHSLNRPADSKVATGKLRLTKKDEVLSDKIHSWPYFVRVEFIAGLIMMLVLIVWSLTIDAPMEEPANPGVTPNPSKAPWYFLGLQEMLVYFDAWMAGVVLPSLIIVGLMVIPYIDINPRGNGYYTLKERWFAVLNFLFGFHVLWVVMIVIGVFLRGPGWNFFMPWQFWDPHKVVALNNVDWAYFLGFRDYWASFFVGAATMGAFFSVIPGVWIVFHKKAPILRQLGFIRYNIVAALFMLQMLLPFKMLLRWTLDIKYIWVTPWFNL
ncbi:MAG: cytochrome C [Myxococcota bacterium]|nr:cytochrome C [Myxococcota bacterium]